MPACSTALCNSAYNNLAATAPQRIIFQR